MKFAQYLLLTLAIAVPTEEETVSVVAEAEPVEVTSEPSEVVAEPEPVILSEEVAEAILDKEGPIEPETTPVDTDVTIQTLGGPVVNELIKITDVVPSTDPSVSNLSSLNVDPCLLALIKTNIKSDCLGILDSSDLNFNDITVALNMAKGICSTKCQAAIANYRDTLLPKCTNQQILANGIVVNALNFVNTIQSAYNLGCVKIETGAETTKCLHSQLQKVQALNIKIDGSLLQTISTLDASSLCDDCIQLQINAFGSTHLNFMERAGLQAFASQVGQKCNMTLTLPKNPPAPVVDEVFVDSSSTTDSNSAPVINLVDTSVNSGSFTGSSDSGKKSGAVSAMPAFVGGVIVAALMSML
ncbi:hypothetical protein HDV02_004348 [Globomyces sp. JEL0801]|nr:hypothetical protein HDV02_004348 [Globomyces sp. JEL0801]